MHKRNYLQGFPLRKFFMHWPLKVRAGFPQKPCASPNPYDPLIYYIMHAWFKQCMYGWVGRARVFHCFVKKLRISVTRPPYSASFETSWKNKGLIRLGLTLGVGCSSMRGHARQFKFSTGFYVKALPTIRHLSAHDLARQGRTRFIPCGLKGLCQGYASLGCYVT